MMEQLIFIASAPRSGSTWFGNLFNSHPDILYRHEPIARLAPFIDNELLRKLKHAHGISDIERQQLFELLYRANPESDRPPFFPKSFSAVPSQCRFLLWVVANNWGPFARLYERCFSPASPRKVVVIKETGWSIHLESLIKCLQPAATIFLLRHPCAIISSILRGINGGLMPLPDIQIKKEWYDRHRTVPFVEKNGYEEKDVLQFDTLTFWALRLRVLYDIFLCLQAKDPERIIHVVYENVQGTPQEDVADLFARLGITLEQNVTAFIEASTGKKTAPLQSLQKKGKSGYFSVHRQQGYNPWRWQTHLSSEEIKSICDIIGEDILQRFWPNSP